MPPTNMLNQAPKGVMQNNKTILFIAGMGILGFVFLLMFKNEQSKNAPPVVNNSPKHNENLTISQPEMPEWMAKFKDMKPDSMAVFNKPKNPQDLERETIEGKKIALKKEIVDDEQSTAFEIQQIEDKDKVEQKKLELSAQEAPLAIAVPPPPSASSASQSSLTSGLGNEIDQLKSTVDDVRGKASDPMKTEGDINNQDEKINFLKSKTAESDYLKDGLEAPKSPYEIKAGTYIPAALISGINSDMPGSIVGQVRENVYDTVTGNTILIPQGTKIVGSYDSKVTFGQSGVLVVWSRLIFPDGSSINLENMQGMDINGLAGFRDKLNNHYLKIYGNALLLSLVGAGYNLLTNNQGANTQYSASAAVASNVGQQLSDVASKSLQRNMDVQPTITIRPGFKFNIFVMKDMILKEVKDAEGTLAYSE